MQERKKVFMVTREHQYLNSRFPLQKSKIRHFDPNLACLHFQLQRKFCFEAMVQLNVRAETHGEGYEINAKPSGENRASSPGFHCTSRMMAANAGFCQRDHIARRAFEKLINHTSSFCNVQIFSLGCLRNYFSHRHAH